MPKQKAHNRCLHCKHEWEDWPGGFAVFRNVDRQPCCPRCKGAYWEWVNYGINNS